MRRREFLAAGVGGVATVLAEPSVRRASAAEEDRRPNVLFLLADQWRAQATGYSGDPNARTPHLDRLARESARFTNAVSCCPVCSPYRACLMTGRYPLSHGVFLNDVPLNTEAVSLAQAFVGAGYETAYIGKWHLDGHGRSAFTPQERRQGFQFWRALECSHDYNRSIYYADEPVRQNWQGYDAIAQTQEAQRYLRGRARGDRPFSLILSWGPPHNPYETAPRKYREMFRAEDIVLRPNISIGDAARARADLAGYYAHIAALDACVGDLLATLAETGLERDTVVVFTSDHGDMHYSHGWVRKQKPWDESVCVPLLVRTPARLGKQGRSIDVPINAPDLMPTLLGLCGVAIPRTVEGEDFSPILRGQRGPDVEGALLMCAHPFGEWIRSHGGKEYRGVRTRTHTYVRDLKGPWLFYDNQADPYQQTNRVDQPEYAAVQRHLDELLALRLKATRDEFLSGDIYVKKWGYAVDKNGTVPYAP